MNIVLVGYGRMGKEVETQALAHDHKIIHTVDPHVNTASVPSLQSIDFKHTQIDIAIEFSHAHSIVEHAHIYAKHSISAVVGTTGWRDEMQKVEQCIQNAPIAYLYGSNFSLGAHIFMKSAEILATLYNAVEEYDVAIYETHHAQKIDRPSGTALSTAKRVLKRLERKTHVGIDIPNGTAIDPSQLAVVSQRIGKEPGYHEMLADSDFDSITLSHKVRTRSGFALGAIKAAEWLHKKKPTGIMPVDQFIDDLFSYHSFRLF